MGATAAFARVESEAGLMALEEEWRALFAAAGAPSPFLDFDWVAMCWRQVARRGGVPLIATVRESGRLVLALPLERRRHRYLFWRYRGLRHLLPQFDDALIDPRGDTAAWVRAARRAPGRTPLHLSLILTNVPAHSPLVTAAPAQGGRARPYAWPTFVELADGYDAYFAQFSSATRNQVRRMQRRLAPDGEVRLRLATPETFEADFDWLLARKRQWTPPRGERLRAWLTDAATEDDLRALARKWIPTGQMVLGCIDAGGRPVAGVMTFTAGRTMVLYLITYDQVAAAASPGRILILKLMEWAAANGVELVDFMAGRSDWKERLKTGGYTQHRVKLPLRSWFG